MSDDMASCQHCGGDGYFEWELDDGKCKTCIVQDCDHAMVDRNYMGSNSHRARFEEICLNCGVFREIRCVWFNQKIIHGPWRHDEVREDEIE